MIVQFYWGPKGSYPLPKVWENQITLDALLREWDQVEAWLSEAPEGTERAIHFAISPRHGLGLKELRRRATSKRTLH